MQCGLLYLSIYTHGIAVPAMLDISATWSFVSCKLAAKLPDISTDYNAPNCNIAYGEDNGCHISYPIRYADWWFYLYVILLYITPCKPLNIR